MQPLVRILVLGVGMLASAGGVYAQRDLLVPAGTLLHCTLNEPNFSSATATVGDPIICHLRAQQEFGKVLFPRGSMLGGHLEAEKEPGHFFGKGYLKITFDRVILPYGDLPVPAKVIQAQGFKVDKKGDIDGKGHPKRDVAEWMIPLFGDPQPAGKRDVLEGRLIALALDALRLGTSVVLDFGLWSRDERSSLRWLARSAGASSQVVYLPVDRETQRERIQHRWSHTPHETFVITEPDMDGWRSQFEAPDAAELAGDDIADPPPAWSDWAAWAAARWPTSIADGT